MATQKDPCKVVTGKVRFSYAHLFEPTSMDGTDDKAKYSVSLLIPKKDKGQVEKIKTAIAAALEEGKSTKFGGKKFNFDVSKLLRDGDTERESDPTYAGMYFLNAKSVQRPGVFDENGDEVLDAEEVYSGCYGKAIVRFYAYNTNGNKGVACGLNGVKKTHEGEKLSGSSVSAADFDDDGEEDDMM